MSATLMYHHDRADLTFTWNSSTQITIRAGSTVPHWGVYPDRISVGELPFTLSALRDACDAWWEGREITTGRNFAEHPWTTYEFSGRVQIRYQGGPFIEAVLTEHCQPLPANSMDWQPIIDLAADDRTPTDVTTDWLYRRTNGWTTGVLEHLGIHAPQQVPDSARYGDGTGDSVTAWTIRHLPTQVKADSTWGAWTTWFAATAREVWNAPQGPEQWRNAGIVTRPVADWAPWTYQDITADGTRFNFSWLGGNSVHITCPDNPRLATLYDSTFLLHPREQATGPLLPWLQEQARQWIANCTTTQTLAEILASTPGNSFRHAPWQIELAGPGLSAHAPCLTEEEAYKVARQARDNAANEEGVSFRSIFRYHDSANGVSNVCVKHWNPEENLWRTHSRPWNKNNPAPDALIPYPSAAPAS
ncbi:hypothetical protein OG413_41445 [Streptomyces sp. NBC_01433]|uniref:hypothetical protein n=1 Tax=Streptomyces sp. NBC_01433 TaxID=2903864 RepID=UPI00225BFE45|nr:hypothetical protein [Streptomyces sp. NBC_01433]MCX4681669.1 hypothetical protein [Streptomyces sp. NBC_01433]